MKIQFTSGQKLLFAAPLLALAIAAALWMRPAAETSPSLRIQGVQSIKSLAFSGDGRRLAVFFRNQQFGQLGGQIADAQSLVKIRDLQSIPDTEDIRAYDYHQPVWSDDGKSIASFVWPLVAETKRLRGGKPVRMGIWDAENGQLKSDFPFETDNPLRDSKLQFSPDGKTLQGEGVSPVTYEVAMGRKLVQAEKHLPLNFLAKSNDELGLWAIRNIDGRRLQVVEAKTRRVLWTIRPKGFVRFSWRGDVLRVVDSGHLLLWDGKTRRPFPSLPFQGYVSFAGIGFRPHSSVLTFSQQTRKPSGNRERPFKDKKNELVAWDYRSNRVLWRVITPVQLFQFRWSPDGKRLAALTVNSPFRLTVFDQNGKIQFERENVDEGAEWSSDSRQLAFIEPEYYQSTRITIASHVKIQRFME